MARMSPHDRRQVIIDATLEVARERGLGATTVREVASRMETSSGLVHHYFDSMDDLLAAAFEQAASGDLQRARAALANAPTPTAALDVFVRSYAPAHSDWTMQLWLDAWAEAARRPALQRVSRRLNREWQSIVSEIIAAGATSGEFRSDDPDAAAWRLLSLLDGLALQVVAHDALITRDQVIEWAALAARRELS